MKAAEKVPDYNLYPSQIIPFPGQNETENYSLECGWGKLVFSQTYTCTEKLIQDLQQETTDRRNIAFYVHEPHVILGLSPQALFLDPSHTYRIQLDATPAYQANKQKNPNYVIRRVKTRKDTVEMNRLYANCNMVEVPNDFIWKQRKSKVIHYLVVEDIESGNVIGTVTGFDHVEAFGDETNGSSLWCLAVDHQSPHPGIGTALVSALIGLFNKKNRSYMDLSVLHDNVSAIELYEKLGFEKIPIFAVKHKNPINEALFIGHDDYDQLNPYAKIIIKEAKRRGITVDILSTENNLFKLTCGGRSITCHESLTELTSSIALLRCHDKSMTHKIFCEHQLAVPKQARYSSLEDAKAFLKDCQRCVVKPLDSEQGEGISIDIRTDDELEKALALARQVSNNILLEEYCPGKDLRIIVIGNEVVAAAIRKPPCIFGNGVSTIRTLIEKQSRRRQAATGGESKIPLDDETKRTIAIEGYTLDSILEKDKKLIVRKLANLHTGGTIHDVTDSLHPHLKEVAITAAMALEIPVVGLDLLVEAPDQPGYKLIEANERPGLANHEPQPTAERFIDFLFPQTCL